MVDRHHAAIGADHIAGRGRDTLQKPIAPISKAAARRICRRHIAREHGDDCAALNRPRPLHIKADRHRRRCVVEDQPRRLSSGQRQSTGGRKRAKKDRPGKVNWHSPSASNTVPRHSNISWKPNSGSQLKAESRPAISLGLDNALILRRKTNRLRLSLTISPASDQVTLGPAFMKLGLDIFRTGLSPETTAWLLRTMFSGTIAVLALAFSGNAIVLAMAALTMVSDAPAFSQRLARSPTFTEVIKAAAFIGFAVSIWTSPKAGGHIQALQILALIWLAGQALLDGLRMRSPVSIVLIAVGATATLIVAPPVPSVLPIAAALSALIVLALSARAGHGGLTSETTAPAVSDFETAKSHFLAHVRHELRTPLTAIIGYAELAADDLAANRAPSQADISNIQDQAQKLAQMMDDLLRLADPDDLSRQIRPKPVRLSAFLTDLKKSIAPIARRYDANLIVGPAPTSDTVMIDSAALTQILIALCAAACGVSDNREVRIILLVDAEQRLTAKLATKAAEAESDALRRLLTSFSPGDANAARRGDALGIRLVAARRLASACGGELSISNSASGELILSVSAPAPLALVDVRCELTEPLFGP